MKVDKEFFYQFFSLVTASISVAIVFTLLNYSKIAENTYQSLYPYIIQHNYREAFLNVQRSEDFHIQSIEYQSNKSPPIFFFQKVTSFIHYTKILPLYIDETKEHSLGKLIIKFDLIPEIKTLVYSIVILTLIFGPVHWKFLKVIKEVREEKVKNEVFKQVIHDVQSPILAIKNLLQKPGVYQRPNQVDDIATQIEVMLDSLSKKKTIDETLYFDLNLNVFLENFLKEKKFEFEDSLSIDYHSTQYDVFVSINPNKFKRAISNLINNALESYEDKSSYVKKSVKISIHSNNHNAILEIQDFGKGIPESQLDKIMKQGVSHDKPFGSGLGLSYAINVINSLNGKLKINSTIGKGTTVKITLPKLPKRQKYFLVEDEFIIRAGWKRSAELKGIQLLSFSNMKEFFESKSLFSKDDTFYLDSNLENGEKGELLAQRLWNENFQNIYLVTGYPKSQFSKLKFIKGIFGKEPIFNS